MVDEGYAIEIVESMPKHEGKIDDLVLSDILGVYEFGEKEDLGRYPNDYICDVNGVIMTTWSKIFEIRDRLKSEVKIKEDCSYREYVEVIEG